MKRLTWLNKLGSLRRLSTVGAILSPIVDGRFVPYPYFLTFVVTHRCNSRCQMCNLWRDKESLLLSLDQIERIFSQNDFFFVRSLTLTGGEPTLRADLPQLFELLLKHIPNLEHLFLATNGLVTHRIVDHVSQMLETLERLDHQVSLFEVQISLDGVGEVHDVIRGIPGFFQHVQATLAQLQALQRRFPQLVLRLSCVLTPYNLPHIDALDAFARQQNLSIYYSPAILTGEYYNNLDKSNDLAFSGANSVDAHSFFERLGQKDQTSLRYYYQDVARMMEGKPRGRRCMMGFYGFVLEYDGNVYPCVNCEAHSFGNLLTDAFEDVWFSERAIEARRKLAVSCCPTCPSACYPLPVNAREVVETSWRKWRRRLSDGVMSECKK